MANEEPNPFEVQPQPQSLPPQWGGMPQITPQEGQEPYAGGSFFQLSPEAMQMMWAPQQQQQIQPPQINPYA
jgi:hypothetical protein